MKKKKVAAGCAWAAGLGGGLPELLVQSQIIAAGDSGPAQGQEKIIIIIIIKSQLNKEGPNRPARAGGYTQP